MTDDENAATTTTTTTSTGPKSFYDDATGSAASATTRLGKLNRINKSMYDKPLVLLVEYPYLIKSTYASIDPNLVIVDSELNQLTVHILQVRQPMTIDSLSEHISVDPVDDHIAWHYRYASMEDESLHTFRYYAAVKLDSHNSHLAEHIADTLYNHHSTVLNLKPATVKSKLALGTYTQCSMNLSPCSIVWVNNLYVNAPNFNLILISKVPAISGSYKDPYYSVTNVDLMGVPIKVEKFTSRSRDYHTCVMHNGETEMVSDSGVTLNPFGVNEKIETATINARSVEEFTFASNGHGGIVALPSNRIKTMVRSNEKGGNTNTAAAADTTTDNRTTCHRNVNGVAKLESSSLALSMLTPLSAHPSVQQKYYLAVLSESISKQCFDSVYEMPESCVAITPKHWMHYDHNQVPYHIVLVKSGVYSAAAAAEPVKANRAQPLYIVDTERSVDPFIATFHRMKFFNVEVHPFGLCATDEMGNIMYVGVVDKLFTLSTAHL